MNQERGHSMEVIIRSPGRLIEEVVLECPDLTWNQVFCALDRLYRMGHVRLTAKGQGRYSIAHPRTGNSSA